VGEQLFMQAGFGYATYWTSPIKSFDEENMLLTTENSIYQVEVYEE